MPLPPLTQQYSSSLGKNMEKVSWDRLGPSCLLEVSHPSFLKAKYEILTENKERSKKRMQYFVSILLHCRGEQPHHIISNAINTISHFNDYFSSALTMRLCLIIFEKYQICTWLGLSVHVACFWDVVSCKTQSVTGKKKKLINKGKRGKRQIRANGKRISHCRHGFWSL